jgi:Ca-activated chloride channel family protein
MKPFSIAALSVAGMLLTSMSVYSLTPPRPVVAEGGESNAPLQVAGTVADGSTFRSGTTVSVEGRVGHARLQAGAPGETLVLLEVRGADTAGGAPPPINLSLAIDRSGSMRGGRLQNAINAAIAAVDRLRDGDVVSVVAFDTGTSIVVPPTTVAGGVRERTAAEIRRIALGGDTCISCGIDAALSQLERTTGKVSRMIVLSDGLPTAGTRDEQGFRELARRARDRGATVTTIGVGVGYDERILGAIAQEANGQHYFVENDATLAKAFEAEAEALGATVASEAEAVVELAPGVEVEQIFGRSFRRNGNKVSVALGTLARGELKTVLMRVRVPASAPGTVQVADVQLAYRGVSAADAGSAGGKLAVEVVAAPAQASELDPVVAARVARDQTAAALREASDLFAAGKADEARKRLDDQGRVLRDASTRLPGAASPQRAKEVAADIDGQIAAVDETSTSLKTQKPATAKGKALPKRVIEVTNPFSR